MHGALSPADIKYIQQLSAAYSLTRHASPSDILKQVGRIADLIVKAQPTTVANVLIDGGSGSHGGSDDNSSPVSRAALAARTASAHVPQLFDLYDCTD